MMTWSFSEDLLKKRADIVSIKRGEKQPSGIGISTTAGGVPITPAH